MLEGYTQHIGIDSPDDVYAGVDTGVYCPDNYMLGGAAESKVVYPRSLGGLLNVESNGLNSSGESENGRQ